MCHFNKFEVLKARTISTPVTLTYDWLCFFVMTFVVCVVVVIIIIITTTSNSSSCTSD